MEGPNAAVFRLMCGGTIKIFWGPLLTDTSLRTKKWITKRHSAVLYRGEVPKSKGILTYIRPQYVKASSR